MTTNQLPNNPFALLRVSTEATRNEVMERCKQLTDDTDNKERQIAYRKATEQIVHHPFKRLVQAAWEMPDTDYEDHDETWQKFARAFRSNPVTLSSLHQLADAFVEENFHPDRLLELLSPLLKVSRPTEKRTFTLSPPTTDDLHHPLSSNELF